MKSHNVTENYQATQGRPELEDDDTIDIFGLLRTLWIGKWLILFFTIVAISYGVYKAYVEAVPLYRATTVVILDVDQSSPIDLASVISGPTGGYSEIRTELQVFQARTLLRRVVERLDLISDPEFNPKLREPSQVNLYRRQVITFVKDKIKEFIGWNPAPAVTPASVPEGEVILNEIETATSILLRKLSVQNVDDSFVFNVSITSESARKATLIADTLSELYIINQIDVKFDAMEQATTFLSDRVAELQIELETAEAAISEFTAETDLVSLEIIRDAELELSELRMRTSEATATLTGFEEQLSAYQSAGSMAEKVAVANDAQLTRLAVLAEQDSVFNSEFGARFDTLVERVAQNVSSAKAQRDSLLISVETLETRIAQQSRDLIGLQQLTREAEATRLLYEYFLTRLKEVSAQQGIQQADSRILSNAVRPRGPISPQKTRIVLLHLILGLIFGAGLVLLRAMRKQGFKTAQELEQHTGISVFGQLPNMKVTRRKNVLAYLKEKPASSAAEAVRDLRTSLMLSNIDKPPQVIVSTSSIPGEGKTTTSLALALNSAAMGKKVLLLEGDIRRRTLSDYFKDVPKEGMVSLLTGEKTMEDVVMHSDDYGFDVVFGEKSSLNAADVFSSKRFAELIEEQREAYDIIIIDTPPVLVVPDARIIAQNTDALLFSVQWDSTSKAQVDESIRLLRNAKENISGLVLGQIDFAGMKRYGYTQEGGAYGSYGAKYYSN